MNSHSTLQTILDLLIFLNKSRYGVSRDNILHEFGINERTFYRYINTIKQAGFVVDRLDKNKYKINQQESEYQISDLLHFSKEEEYILSKAIHSIDDSSPIKSNLINKLYSLYDSKIVKDLIIKQQNSENIEKLSQAIALKKQVILENYRSSNRNVIKDIIVEPINFTTNYISLIAFDIESQTTKTYKIARIGNVQISDITICNKHKHKQIVSDVFRFSGALSYPIKLECSLLAYNLMIEEYPLSEQFFTKNNDKYIFESEVCDFRGVGRFVLGLRDQITVLKSVEFKEYLQKVIINDKI